MAKQKATKAGHLKAEDYYYYLLQLSFHSVVLVLTLVTNNKKNT